MNNYMTICFNSRTIVFMLIYLFEMEDATSFLKVIAQIIARVF